MRRQNSPFLFSVALALVLFAPHVLLAQYAISTVAGGGPNNLTALNASIGYPGGVASDGAGNTYIADSQSVISSKSTLQTTSPSWPAMAFTATQATADQQPAQRSTVLKAFSWMLRETYSSRTPRTR